MELRSSRSRSRTPFILSTYDTEINEDQAGRTMIRTTRSSTKITSTSFDNFTASSNNLDSTPAKSMKTRSSKSEKVFRRARYKTSDYSSEDGETNISPTSENTNNHFLEDSRDSASRSTGSVSAIDYYRAAGDYWNKYPKTDYTYSLNSKDKTEIAPGVVAMPNMSRRSLHASDSCNDFILAHKQTNTEDEIQYTPTYPYSNSNNDQFLRTRRTNLYANNNYNVKYKSMLSREDQVQKTFRSRIAHFFLTIFTWISSTFYYMYSTQNSVLIRFGKMVHQLATRVMLWDTWLLRSLKNKNKVTSLLAVCLIPLLLFGGWWLLSHLGSLLTKTQNTVHENIKVPIMHNDAVVEKKLEENVAWESSKFAAKLSSDQLQEIANLVRLKLDLENYNSDVIVEKLIASPKVQNLIHSYKFSGLEDSDSSATAAILRNQEKIIDELKNKIHEIRLELMQLEKIHNKDIAQLRLEHDENMGKLSIEINRCCIQMENYITNLLKDLFQAPNNLGTYKDISEWIRSTFVAKEYLETRLLNTTQNLQSQFDNVIKNNVDVLMSEVMSRVSAELNQRIDRANVFTEDADINLEPITDERIRKIVRQSLMIYDADKTGLVDYALESAGGQILTTRCTESYQARTAVISILGIPIWYQTNNPRTVITPGVVPGECWAFQNFPAFLVIKLASRIKIDAFSYEHISKLVASNGKIDSAPKEFLVYGLQNESDSDPLLLGQYFYNYDGPPLQHFAAGVHDLAFNIVELKILSNHGNPSYTCLYRFRVHGRLDTNHT